MSQRSSLSSIPMVSTEKMPLQLVAWGPGSLSHWAIFVPYQVGYPNGILYHIGYEAKSSGFSCTATTRLSKHHFQVAKSGPNKSFTIPRAFATFAQVEDAATRVFEDYKRYNLVTRNCQNFALDILLRLHQLYPSSVPASAIQDVRRRGTISTFIASITRRDPVAYPESGDRPGNPNRYSID
ncbi:hypothetical protein BO79DRAFT_209361 [Aspergillus costaricaensis CBS 115574]|uniref:Uncharacterized protein n=1 Tax=Aspergillus costaricaensis CBS 115574 TaxID=1448317 RepID=A0ACD1IBV5_9EURO|nr:hypothetical protein BO79DRAFT_209361 [Aspergillus costaricaensis CBS 115574]RAK87957.1 hypothetical protein BO79DRAFT_209361 [Aspergillus costaricaensis CBS 115574]